MCPGCRHVEHRPIEDYYDTIRVVTYPSGERRIGKDPPKEVLEAAFNELGTHSAVASAFGVSRAVVTRWLNQYQMEVTFRPETGAASYIKRLMAKNEDRQTIAQWLVDEGSVSVAYLRRDDLTSLIVCGSMNDFDVLTRISTILGKPITCSKSPSASVLPLGMVRVHGAKAFALLQILLDSLFGLKAMEAKAALEFFPPSGSLKGRHTTDEFMIPVWREFALRTLKAWNSRRRLKMEPDEIERLSETWVEGRIRRARRFVDAPGEKESH
jgi:hypothetical protein